MKMFFFLCLFSLAGTAFSLEVDQAELKQAENQPIEFVNYTGTHTEIDSLEEIAEIGKILSIAAKNKSGRAGPMNRYALIHAVDPSEKNGFDADILVIGEDARVDHINNFRVIIASYLQNAYGYTQKDAATIAHFVTLYNAVYRGDLDALIGRYKKVVTRHLDSEKAGLALRYDEWPGRTQIIIPLSNQKYHGTLSTVNTSSISDKKIVGNMRKRDDMDMKNRKDMLDLKKRESDAARKRAEKARKEAEAAKREIAKARKEAQDAKKRAEESKRLLELKKIQEQKEREATEESRFADKKEKEVNSDRKNVEVDTRKIIENNRAEKKLQEDAAFASVFPGTILRITDSAKMLSELVLIDLKTGKMLKTSGIKTIRGFRFFNDGSMLVAIAGKGGKEPVSLIGLHPITLNEITKSEVAIAEQSLLIQDGDNYYAVLDKKGKYVLGRFDSDLILQAESKIPVMPYTSMTMIDKGLLVQDTHKTIKLIDKDSLVEIPAKNTGKK